MPQAIGAAVNKFVAATLFKGGVGTITAGTIGAISGTIATAATYAGIAKALSPKTNFNRASGVAASLQGRQFNARGPIEYQQAVYGEVPVGGQFALMEETGTKNEFLHIAIVHCAHEVEELGDLFINDVRVPLTSAAEGVQRVPVVGNRYRDHVRVYDHLGNENQSYDSVLGAATSKWTSNHRLRGKAWTYIRLNLDPEDNVFEGGFPRIGRVVKGKRVYDPRIATKAITGATQANPVVITATAHGYANNDRVRLEDLGGMTELNGASYRIQGVTANTFQLEGVDGTGFTAYTSGGTAREMPWSDNAALCAADYLLSNMGYGRQGLQISHINDAAWQAAANVCDESVTLDDNAWITGQYVTAGTRRTSDTSPVKLYEATTDGTTGATAPTGTGTAIDDGGVTWDYVETFTNTESRYTCNGVVRSDEDPVLVTRKLKSAMGNAFIEFIGGEFWIHAGAWRASTVTLTADDFAGGISGQTKDDRRNASNRVRGVFANKDDDWRVTEYPAVTNATYLSEDQGIESWRDLDLPFTTSHATAQRIAKQRMERNRQGLSHTARFKLKAMRIQPGDNFALDFSKYGYGASGTHTGGDTEAILTDSSASWGVNTLVGLTITNDDDGSSGTITANTATTVTATLSGGTDNHWDNADSYTIEKWFHCVTHQLIKDPGGPEQVEMSFRETAPGEYDWNNGEETVLDPSPNSNLPSPYSIPDPTALALDSSETQLIRKGEAVISRLKVSWTASALQNVRAHEIQWKKTADAWADANSQIVAMPSEAFFISDVDDGEDYDVRVRGINAISRSGWDTETAHTIVGKSTAPATPTGLAAVAGNKEVRLTWAENTEVDFSRFLVFHNTTGTAPNPALDTPTLRPDNNHAVIDGLTNGTLYYFWVVAVDTVGLKSALSASTTETPSGLLEDVDIRGDGTFGVSAPLVVLDDIVVTTDETYETYQGRGGIAARGIFTQHDDGTVTGFSALAFENKNLLYFDRSRGDFASPLAVNSGEIVAEIAANVYNAGGTTPWSQGPTIILETDVAPTTDGQFVDGRIILRPMGGSTGKSEAYFYDDFFKVELTSGLELTLSQALDGLELDDNGEVVLFKAEATNRLLIDNDARVNGDLTVEQKLYLDTTNTYLEEVSHSYDGSSSDDYIRAVKNIVVGSAGLGTVEAGLLKSTFNGASYMRLRYGTSGGTNTDIFLRISGGKIQGSTDGTSWNDLW